MIKIRTKAMIRYLAAFTVFGVLVSNSSSAQTPPSPVSVTAGWGCFAYATGLGATASSSPEISAYAAPCLTPPAAAPFLGSVTQEDNNSNHNLSCNWLGPAWNYMADTELPDSPNNWITLTIANNIATVGVDGLTNATTINPTTCWPEGFGHVFAGWNDLTATANAIYKHDLVVEFDIRLVTQSPEVNTANAYAGSRVTLGMAVKNDYLELDWEQPGYAASLNEPSDGSSYCTNTVPYEACQYGPGFEVKFLPATAYGAPALGPNWVHVKLPISKIAKSLTWYHQPRRSAGVAFYFGVESKGAKVQIQLMNWNPYWLPAKAN